MWELEGGISMTVDIASALADRNLLGAALPELESWGTWLACLKAAHGLELDKKERTAFEAVAGGRKSPSKPVRELWAIVGRRGGKSRVAAALAVYEAALVDHSEKLAPGETGMILVLAAAKDQAAVVFRYCVGFLEASPLLAGMIDTVSQDTITLKNGITIAVGASSFRTVRGPTLLGCVFDETAYWRDDTSANPDLEVYRAVRPALLTTRGMLVGIGSPYRRKGLLHDRHRDYFGKDDDRVLVVQGPTTAFNPNADKAEIARDTADDPEAARSEWEGEFRSDISSLLDDQLIDAAIDHTRPLELPPRQGIRYFGFVDASAGRHDAFSIGISHREGERIVIDVVRGRKPPFDPAQCAAEFAVLAKQYRCAEVVGDNFAGEWVAAPFKGNGVSYRQCEHPKSQLYLEGLPSFTRGQISIPDHPQLLRELRLLERRVSRSGNDTVDHPRGGSDDHANVCFGALWLAIGVGGLGPIRINPNFMAEIHRAAQMRAYRVL
jgi:hypothetical protein